MSSSTRIRSDSRGGAVLLWFRIDLRLDDNSALRAAAASGRPVIPFFIWDPRREHPWAPGQAARWWLEQSLIRLDESLRQRDSRLLRAAGPTELVLARIRAAAGATAIYWNERYEPAVREADDRLRRQLEEEGVTVNVFSDGLLFPPGTIRNRAGRPFRVFSPFWRACLTQEPEPAQPAPRGRLLAPQNWPRLDSLDITIREQGTGKLGETWTPGEAGARSRWRRFREREITGYAEQRDRPDLAAVSRLSPHLHFGEISPRRLWSDLRRASSEEGFFPPHRGAASFLAELGWREFAWHLLVAFPSAPEHPLRESFRTFPWRKTSRSELERWRQGLTGYPLVDAGMRQLGETGWMHNRLRMVTASFLTKHLLIDWREGVAWFWDKLVDADLANNTLGWQWASGCGADAAPYFRIFNPASQGARYDPDGDYVRKWVPELAGLPGHWLHQPWAADDATLRRAGVRLGQTYPLPQVDHAAARRRALEAFASALGRQVP